MSTNAIIAREVDAKLGKFEGRYHHWDGYPTGLGKTLHELYNGHFKKDLSTMLKVLLEDHPAGWSTIIDTDFNQEPGYIGDVNKLSEYNTKGIPTRPRCYCHGDRHEPDNRWTEKNETCPYAYVFLKDKPAMIILNGYGNIWKFIAEVDLEKEKIDWEKIENEAN